MDNVTFAIMLLQVVVLLIALGIFVGCVIAIYLALIYRKMKTTGSFPLELATKGSAPLAPGAVAALIPAAAGASIPEPEPAPIDPHRAHDLNESVRAVAGKYGLSTVTIATRDGLVVAGSGGDAQADAAKYSHAFATGAVTAEEGIRVFGIARPGQELVGIVRAQKNFPQSRLKELEDDVKNVLDWWL
jgi:hypothetical protein